MNREQENCALDDRLNSAEPDRPQSESLDIAFADADVERRVRALIRWTLDPARDRVDVKVTDGWAVLTGDVSLMRRRNDIGRHVRCLPGVRGLDNRVSVRGVIPTLTH